MTRLPISKRETVFFSLKHENIELENKDVTSLIEVKVNQSHWGGSGRFQDVVLVGLSHQNVHRASQLHGRMWHNNIEFKYSYLRYLLLIWEAFLKSTLYSPQKLEARDLTHRGWLLADVQQHCELPEQPGHVTGWEASKEPTVLEWVAAEASGAEGGG